MNKNMLLVTSVFLLALGQASFANAQSAAYRVTFEGKWTTAATPGGVPSGAHFSPLIGAVHNDGVTFWRSGGTASAGIESMAEIGGTSTLRGEIASAGSNVHATLEKSVPSGGTGTAAIEFTVTPTHPLVTLVTMVAPSPDWFVGVSGLSLREGNDWLASVAVDLFPYDAGTEEGTEFSLSNPSTSPRGVISSIRGTGKFSNEPIATMTFTLQTPPEPDPEPDPDPDPGGDDSAPVPLDAAAAREHLFPLLADGDGFRSYFFLTDVSGPDNRCALELLGAGLDAARIEEHAALAVSDSKMEIVFDEAGASVALTTAGERPLAFGYARLSCAQPAVARILLALENDGSPIAMTNLESAQAANSFLFPILLRSGRLALVLANDNALEATCAVEVETADGNGIGGGSIAVPARSNFFGFLDETVTIPDGVIGDMVSVTCDRAVAAVSLPFTGAAFAAIPPVVPGSDSAPN